jgi:hypothetical protein
MDTKSTGSSSGQETGQTPKTTTGKGDGEPVEMTMRVEEYLAHIAEYRLRQRPPPTEFNGFP